MQKCLCAWEAQGAKCTLGCRSIIDTFWWEMVLCKRKLQNFRSGLWKGKALSSHHIHTDFKVNDQRPFLPNWPEPESALATSKAQIKAEPSPQMGASLLVLEKEWDGVSLSPCSDNEKRIYLNPRKVSEICNNSIMVCDCSGQRTVNRICVAPTGFNW